MQNYLSIIDLTDAVNSGIYTQTLRKTVLENLHKTGVLLIKDPRVNEKDNDKFIDMMEKYYSQKDNVKRKDIREKVHYQVGLTPAYTETPLDHCEKIFRLNEKRKNFIHKPKGKDPKERFLWHVNKKSVDNIIPEGFDNWENNMVSWSTHMSNTVKTISKILALSLDLDINFFTTMCNRSDTLLAPTGMNLLNKKEHNIIAGYHNDISFLTIHGKSRYPGLFIWLRDNTKIQVQIPDGCLLIQAGKQLEHLTGGYIQAGFHEVVVTKEALNKVLDNYPVNCPVRVSSTMFVHTNDEVILSPIQRFVTEKSKEEYPLILKSEWLIKELKKLSL